MESYSIYVELNNFLLYIGNLEVWKIFLYYLSIYFGLAYNWISEKLDSVEGSAPTDVVMVLAQLIYHATATVLLTLKIFACRFTIINFTKWLLVKLGFVKPRNVVWNFFTIIICYIDMRIIQNMLKFREPFELEFPNNV